MIEVEIIFAISEEAMVAVAIETISSTTKIAARTEIILLVRWL